MTQSSKEQRLMIQKKMFIIGMLTMPIHFITVISIFTLLTPDQIPISPILSNLNLVYIMLGICAPVSVWALVKMPILAIKIGKLEHEIEQNDQ